MKDRVYDRAIPRRLGWMVFYDPGTHTGTIEWDDGAVDTEYDVDQLGGVPDWAA